MTLGKVFQSQVRPLASTAALRCLREERVGSVAGHEVAMWVFPSSLLESENLTPVQCTMVSMRTRVSSME